MKRFFSIAYMTIIRKNKRAKLDIIITGDFNVDLTNTNRSTTTHTKLLSNLIKKNHLLIAENLFTKNNKTIYIQYTKLTPRPFSRPIFFKINR